MELKWLDDYIALIEAGTFSAAAERRHVSQPAFSRRIQMLEDWLGVALVDRTRKPIRFTPAAQAHEAAIRSLVARIYEFRAELKSEAIDSTGITIAAQHTLAAAYLPGLMDRLRRLHPDQGLRIRSENRADSVAMLMRGQAEVLITYETAQAPCGIPAPIAQRHLLGQDALVLVACPALHKSLRLRREGESVPMLCFPPDSFFGQVLRVEAMPALMRRHPVLVRCVSEFAMGLRELALVGQGAAWLPELLVAEDIRAGRLLVLKTLGLAVPMDIVMYAATDESPQGAGRRALVLSLREGAGPQRPARRSGAAGRPVRTLARPGPRTARP